MKKTIMLGALIALTVSISLPRAGSAQFTDIINAVVNYNSTSDGNLTSNYSDAPISYILSNENPIQFGSGLLGVNLPNIATGGSLATPVSNFTTVSCTYKCNVNLTTSKSGDRLLTTVLASDGLYHVVTGTSSYNTSTNTGAYVTPALSLWTPAIASGSSVSQAALVFTGYKNSGGGHRCTISAIAVNGTNPPVFGYELSSTGTADTLFNFEPAPPGP